MRWVVSAGTAVHLTRYANARFVGLTPKTSAGETPAVTPAEPSSIVLASAQATLDNQLVTLYASLPARTALIILTGRSDPRRMASLNARNSTFESAIRDGKKAEDIDKADWWTASDGQELKEESEEGEKGTVVFGKQVKG
jgi:RNA exonuclease 1